jgi:hypothetical protein
MGIVKTLAVTFIKSGAQAVINAADFDPAVHRKGAVKFTPKKKAGMTGRTR